MVLVCTASSLSFIDNANGGDFFANSETDTDLRAWVNKHPTNWSSHEVLDWVYYVAAKMDCGRHRNQGREVQQPQGREFTANDACGLRKFGADLWRSPS